MRLARLISFGTERYPEKVARRLRIVNVGAWSAAILATPLTIVRITDIAHPAFAVGNLLFIALAAAVPLLHRFGPQAALLALVFLLYAFTFRIAFYVGTSDGVWLNFVSGAALTTLLVGAERIRLAAGVAVLSVGLVVLLHMVVPKDTVLMASRLSPFAKLTANVAANTVILVLIVFYAVRQFERAEAAAEREHARSESLLLSILPATVAERLKGPHKPFIADKYEEASILFADMAGHTALASEMSPEEVVRFLNRVFTQFDDLVEKHGLEKIKTAGDGYVVVSGVPTPRSDHARALAQLALELREEAAGFRDPRGRPVPIRIGISSGPVVAGIIGTKKIFYDVWGDAVNVASRMESTGVVGMIQASEKTYSLLKDDFVLEPRGLIDIKGKGLMPTWSLIGRRPATDRNRL
jgi:adenylate cyclase